MIAAAGTPGGYRTYDEMEKVAGADMLRRMIQSFQRAGVEDIVVVTGYRAEETEKNLVKMGVVFLRSTEYDREQMLDQAVRGLNHLKKTCGRIFFCPAGVPLFTEDTVRSLMKEEGKAVIPMCGGRKGHPILVDAGLTGQIASYRGERGLKGALDAAGVKETLVPVDDRGVVVRSSEDAFVQVLREEGKQKIHPKIKLQLVRDDPFFGPGIVVLLRQIAVLGSVREACEKTGMSYSKGWSLIRKAEAELGDVIVDRSPGGRMGGSAQVTATGMRLLEQYERLEKEVAQFAGERYREIFKN